MLCLTTLLEESSIYTTSYLKLGLLHALIRFHSSPKSFCFFFIFDTLGHTGNSGSVEWTSIDSRVKAWLLLAICQRVPGQDTEPTSCPKEKTLRLHKQVHSGCWSQAHCKGEEDCIRKHVRHKNVHTIIHCGNPDSKIRWKKKSTVGCMWRTKVLKVSYSFNCNVIAWLFISQTICTFDN